MSGMRNRVYGGVSAIGLLVGAGGLSAQDSLTEIQVSALPAVFEKTADAFSVVAISRSELSARPELRLDEKLKQIPAFGLFRRSGSQIAHPTAQGVTLRSIAPNGAGRTLLLLDGIPQGDPFGGWVNWARLPLINLDHVYLVKGGGTGQWGSGAIAGTINMSSRIPESSETYLSASYGSFDTFDVAASTHVGDAANGITFSGNYYNSDGAYIIAADQRGSVDTRAKGEGGWFRIRTVMQVAEAYSLQLSAGFSDENRLNGTVYTGNGTRVWETSSRLVKQIVSPEDWAFEVGAYLRDQEFYSRFSGVADDRSNENPALDQYSVPSKAYGFNALVSKSFDGGWKLEFGADYRKTSGATNEQYFNSGGGFIRERSAGGEQQFLGFFAEATKDITQTLSLSIGARLDHFKDTDGHRTEIDLTDDSILRNDIFASDSDWLPGGRIGLTWQNSERLTVFGAAYSGSRAPSLNELYRPFRVGSDITEANPALAIEKSYGGEFGFSYTVNDSVSMRATYFRNWLEDGVGNITLTTSGGFYGLLGVFVPFGGSLSQRLNVDEIIVDGIEASINVHLTGALSLEGAYFWNNARINKATVNTLIEGNRLAQTPKHKGYAALNWKPADDWVLRVSALASSKQYDDDGNSRALAGYASVDLYASYEVREGLKLFAAGLNVLDEEIITGLRSNGLRSVAEPASFRVGIEATF